MAALVVFVGLYQLLSDSGAFQDHLWKFHRTIGKYEKISGKPPCQSMSRALSSGLSMFIIRFYPWYIITFGPFWACFSTISMARPGHHRWLRPDPTAPPHLIALRGQLPGRRRRRGAHVVVAVAEIDLAAAPGAARGAGGWTHLDWLVVGPPLWKIGKSIGMIRNPTYGKIKNVPNHQPVDFLQVSIKFQGFPFFFPSNSMKNRWFEDGKSMGVPLNPEFYRWIFPNKNHPAIGVPPFVETSFLDGAIKI